MRNNQNLRRLCKLRWTFRKFGVDAYKLSKKEVIGTTDVLPDEPWALGGVFRDTAWQMVPFNVS